MKKTYSHFMRSLWIIMSCMTLLLSGAKAQSTNERLYEFLKRKENRTQNVTETQEINANPGEGIIGAASIRPASPNMTVGLLQTTLDGVVEGIGKQIREQAALISADLRAQLEGVVAQAESVISDIDRRLGDKLEYTFDQLNKTERRFFEDSEALLNQLQYTLYLTELRAYDLVKKSAMEADMLAYSAIGNFKLVKKARFVYLDPSEYRIKDGQSNILFKVRGNYLNLKKYDVFLDGKKTDWVSASEHELAFQIPEAGYKQITTDQFLSVKGSPFSRRKILLVFNKYFKAGEESLAMTLKPQLSYNISVQVTPLAKVPTVRDHNISAYFHTNGACDASYAIDRTYMLPPDYEVAETLDFNAIHISTANCGSRVIPSESRQPSENSIFVRAHLKGCGKTCVNLLFTKVCNCHGNGWLGYSYNFKIKKYDNQFLPAFTQDLTTTNQQSFIFEYPQENIPADNKGVNWIYTIKITTIDGARTKVIELSESNPNVGLIRSRMDNTKLVLELPADVTL